MLNGEALNYFINGLAAKSLKRNDFFIKAGEGQRFLGYISRGFVRSFYVNDKGKEINNHFLMHGEFAVHYSAFVKNNTSKYFFQCLDNTEFIRMTYQHIQLCYQKFPEFERYGRIIAEDIFIKYEIHLENMLFNKSVSFPYFGPLKS